MNGLEKITQRIDADAQAEAEAILAQARAQAKDIRAQARADAEKEAAAILANGEKDAQERTRRMDSTVQMEGRKRLLAAKQEMITRAFDKALMDLIQAPAEKQIDLLSHMAAQAAVTGRERVIFSADDRDTIGPQVVARANELLAQKTAPRLPDEMTQGRLGSLLETAATAVTAIAKGTAMLTLSAETRPICGGFILESDGVEINCSYETLVRLSRSQLARETADILFKA